MYINEYIHICICIHWSLFQSHVHFVMGIAHQGDDMTKSWIPSRKAHLFFIDFFGFRGFNCFGNLPVLQVFGVADTPAFATASTWCSSMCICLYTCTHIHIYLHVCIYVCIYTFSSMYLCTCIYTYMYTHTYIHVPTNGYWTNPRILQNV